MQKMGNCKQAFLFAQGMQAAKLDLDGDSGYLASLFSGSSSIHEFCLSVNVYLHSHMCRHFFYQFTLGNYPRMILKYILCCERSHGK